MDFDKNPKNNPSAPKDNPAAPKISTPMIVIGIVVVLAVLFIGSRLFQGNGDNATPTQAPATSNDGDNEIVQENSDEDLNLGNVVVAEGVDRDGCAVDTGTTFSEDDPFFVVLEDSALPEGTDIYARLYRDDVAVEDTDIVTTSEDYENVCVNFEFSPAARAEEFEPGDYAAEIYVNGNAYETVEFTIR